MSEPPRSVPTVVQVVFPRFCPEDGDRGHLNIPRFSASSLSGANRDEASPDMEWSIRETAASPPAWHQPVMPELAKITWVSHLFETHGSPRCGSLRVPSEEALFRLIGRWRGGLLGWQFVEVAGAREGRGSERRGGNGGPEGGGYRHRHPDRRRCC